MGRGYWGFLCDIDKVVKDRMYIDVNLQINIVELCLFVLAIWLVVLFINRKKKVPVLLIVVPTVLEGLVGMKCSWNKDIKSTVICLIEMIVTGVLLYGMLKRKKNIKDVKQEKEIIDASNAINNSNYLYKINNGNKPGDVVLYSFFGLIIALFVTYIINVLMASLSGGKYNALFKYILGHVSMEGIQLFFTSIFLVVMVDFIQHEQLSKLRIIELSFFALTGFMLFMMIADITDPQVLNTYTSTQQKSNNHKNSHKTPKNNKSKKDKK